MRGERDLPEVLGQRAPEADGWPDPVEFIHELRRTVGLFDGAMPITPKQAWDEAIEHVRLLTTGRCHACMDPRERR